MRLQVGKKYLTRDGRTASINGIDTRGDYFGYVEGDKVERVFMESDCTHWGGDPNLDLVSEAPSLAFNYIGGAPPNTTQEKALTYDEGKEPLARLPWAGVDSMSRVQAYGNSKYSDFENYRKGLEISRNLSCALRHIRDFMNGVDKDPESGESPLGHAMTRVAFVLQNLHDGVAIDDRYSRRPFITTKET